MKYPTFIVITLTLAVLAGGLYWHQHRLLTERYDQAEDRADSLLSTKYHLEGDIRSLQRQIDFSNDDKRYLDQRLNDLHGDLADRNRTIADLRSRTDGQARKIQKRDRTLATLTTNRDSLTAQMEAMQDKISWQQSENKLLLRQQKELQQKTDALDTRLSTMVPRSALTADAFLVQTTKANKKVSAKARKVTALTVSFDVPDELPLEGTQELYLSLTGSDQKAMMAPLRTATITLPDVNEVIPVHAVQSVNFNRNPQRVSFQIPVKSSTQPGIYRAAVFTRDKYLGAVEFQLRDSFWFF